MSVILALGRLRQEDCHEFEVRLGYGVRNPEGVQGKLQKSYMPLLDNWLLSTSSNTFFLGLFNGYNYTLIQIILSYTL